ncbi:MAG: pentapeptide repeat-containing protein [Magnetospirillum sp. WYHS-4]
MSSFDGVSAFTGYVSGTYMTVSEFQPVPSWEGQAVPVASKRVIEDTVTLSDKAQSYLEQKARAGTAEGKATPFRNPDPANLVGADMSGKDFSGVDLTRAFLYRANLANADFSKATLKDAWISESDVAGANFEGADLRGANLAKTKNLTRDQLKDALVDLSTILPFALRLER